MEPIGKQLRELDGRVCLICVGNPDGGDDALGVRLGEELASAGLSDVVIAGVEPENHLARGECEGFDHLIFVDAVNFGFLPGSVAFLSAEEMQSRLPQISTHRLSLGLLARWIESQGQTKAWLLAVQPESLAPQRALSRSVTITLAALKEILMKRFGSGDKPC